MGFLRDWRRTGRYDRLAAMGRDAYGTDPLQYTMFIVQLRSRQLAEITGIDANEIEDEIVRRQISPGDWAAEHEPDPVTFRRRSRYPGIDARGKPFGTLEEVQAQVNAGMAARQERLDRIEAVLSKPGLDPTDERVRDIEAERHHLRTFFWLARGGDKSGERFPNPSTDLSLEEADLLAKLHALKRIS